MELVQRLKDSIAWLGGALAALTAICYAAGYYAFHAHLTMLGLGRVVNFEHQQMLLEGARFFFTVAAQLLRMGLALGAAWVALLVLWTGLRQIGAIDRACRRVGDWLAARRDAVDKSRPNLPGTLLLGAAVVLLILHTDQFFYPLFDLGRVDSLLFRGGVPIVADCRLLIPLTAIGLEPAVAAALLLQGGRCSHVLLGEFSRLLNGYLVLLIALALVFSYAPQLRPALLARGLRWVLVAYALVYTLLLPIGFGVLVRAAVYPIANLEFKGGANARGHVLAREDKNLLLWQSAERKAVWYERESIARIEVVDQGNLFFRPQGDAK